jgi:Coenzyme PQQ synthesis protein D (PqqD)
MTRTMGNDQVILNLATGTYFGLDGVGSRIWQLLVEGSSVSQLQATLVEEYSVQTVALEEDVRILLDSLLQQGLIVRSAR